MNFDTAAQIKLKFDINILSMAEMDVCNTEKQVAARGRDSRRALS